MNLSFGIREKTTLLVIILVAAAAYFTPQIITEHAKRIYEERELVDLADEASLRTWEILDDIERLEETTAKLANDAAYRGNTFRAEVERERTQLENREMTSNEARWKNYLRADVFTGTDDSKKTEILPTHPEYSGIGSHTWVPLRNRLQRANPGDVFLSPIHRLQVQTENGSKSIPVICAGARIWNQADTGDEVKHLLVTLSLERPRSNRHLLLIVDERQSDYDLNLTTATEKSELPTEGRSEVVIGRVKDEVHIRIFNPDGEIAVDKSEVELLSDDNKDALASLKTALTHLWISNQQPDPILKARIVSSATALCGHVWPVYLLHPGNGESDNPNEKRGVFGNKKTFDEIIDSRERTEDKPLRLSLLRLGSSQARDSKGEAVNPKLEKPYYFREATPKIVSKATGKVVTSVPASFSDEVGWILEDLRRGKYNSLDCRIGGIGNQVRQLRLLAPTEELLTQVSAEVAEALTKADYGDFEFKKLDMHPWVKCDEVDTTFVKFEIPAVSGNGEEANKEYQVLFSGFRDEFAISIAQKLRGLEKSLSGIALAAGIIAFISALLYVRPLRMITKTAQSVADSPNEGLHEKVDVISKSLPVARTDEVGEIARALRRLFSEIQANTRELDQRVRERTIELEKANEKLKDVNREKDTFLANVSHELRNPLNVVDGYLQFLEASNLDEEQSSDVRKSRKAAKALLELINDILDYQKITMRGITLEPEKVDLPQFVEDVKDSMEIHAERNKNELVFESNGDLGTILNDNKRLRQVILNLMGNACKFTQEGTVTLDTRRFSENGTDIVEFRVRDTGRGMTPEEQSKIFTVFYTNKKANESGTGLGLAISRELCRLMGGRISLESSVPGKGSTFLVRIPADISEEPPTAEKIDTIPEGSRTVLVIDDNDAVREMMRRYLTKQGYEVVEASDGKEGIELARKLKPDAITLDAVMPEVDGWDVLSTLKSDLDTSSIPVVMVTILNKEAKGFALGADDYIVKPIDWDRFSHVLGNLTDSREQRTILVVDDEPPTRDLFRRALIKEDCHVIEAEDGAEALKVLEETRPDVIVLDLMMPVMDGFEFLAEFHRREDWQSIPVIVVTAKTPSDEERKFLDGTVARVLQKGTGTTEELFATIHRRVDGSGKPQTEIVSQDA